MIWEHLGSSRIICYQLCPPASNVEFTEEDKIAHGVSGESDSPNTPTYSEPVPILASDNDNVQVSLSGASSSGVPDAESQSVETEPQ